MTNYKFGFKYRGGLSMQISERVHPEELDNKDLNPRDLNDLLSNPEKSKQKH